MSRVLSAFLLSAICSLQPAWGGGWESSGSRAQDPAQPTTRPASAAHFECVTTLSRVNKKGDLKEFTRIDELKPEQFSAGTATIVTDGLVDGNSRAAYLAGQQIELNVRDNLQGPGGIVTLKLSLVHRQRGQKLVSSTIVRNDRTSSAISASIETADDQSTLTLEVSCRDLNQDKSRNR